MCSLHPSFQGRSSGIDRMLAAEVVLCNFVSNLSQTHNSYPYGFGDPEQRWQQQSTENISIGVDILGDKVPPSVSKKSGVRHVLWRFRGFLQGQQSSEGLAVVSRRHCDICRDVLYAASRYIGCMGWYHAVRKQRETRTQYMSSIAECRIRNLRWPCLWYDENWDNTATSGIINAQALGELTIARCSSRKLHGKHQNISDSLLLWWKGYSGDNLNCVPGLNSLRGTPPLWYLLLHLHYLPL